MRNRMRRQTQLAALVIALLTWSSTGAAFDLLFERVRGARALSSLYQSSEARAAVRDGLLFGDGSERIERQADGTLHVEQDRIYTRAKHPHTGRLVDLPQPWHLHSTVTLTPALRLRSLDTSLELYRSIDDAMGFAFTDKLKAVFDWRRVTARVSADGKTLIRNTWRAGRGVKTTSFDYPADAIPLEIVGMVLPVAVRAHIDTFEFDLLLPDGALHRVCARVLRTRDLTRFAQGYPLPAAQLRFGEELAVVDLWLASPIKHLFFPHHFYFVYSDARPTQLLAFWGGDPDEHLQAIRQR